MIVLCKVMEKSQPIKIQPVSGGDYSIFTDYYFEPTDILKGEDNFEKITNIPVRIMGGQTEELTVITEDFPSLNPGCEYLLFLYRPGMGTGYNTEGDYFYVTGATQGAYSSNGQQTFVSQYDDSKLTTEELSNQIYDLSGIKVKTKLETFKENCLLNLESGFITEEEYESFMKETNVYATIID